MAGSQDVPPDEVNPFRLDRCPDCGYLLEGLPEQGICPECGFAYRPDMIVLYGWAPSLTANALTTRGWTVFGCLAIFNMSIAFSTYRLLRQGELLYGLLGVGMIVASIAWTLYRRREMRRELPAPVQLRLTPQGIAERTGVGQVKITPWSEITSMAVHWPGGQTHEIHAECAGRLNKLSEATVARFQLDTSPAHMARLIGRLRQWYPKLTLWDTRISNRVRQVTDFGIAGNPPQLTTDN